MTSFCIIDSQSVKNTDTAETKGYDAGKKVSGIKRHIAVDTQGLPHAIHITPANVTDRAGALFMFNASANNFIHITPANVTDRAGALFMFNASANNLANVVNVLADGGYIGTKFALATYEIIKSSVEIVKRNELHKFVVLPKRWIVERSFSWLEKCRRLWKNCERKLNTSLQMASLAFIVLILNRF
jgi:transposase